MNKYYTGKGDKGDTGFFGTQDRHPKSSLRVECLGAVDEANSWVGLCRAKVREQGTSLPAGEAGNKEQGNKEEILEWVQQQLFIVQAELGGSDVHLTENNIAELEAHIAKVSENLPEIKSFVLPGASEMAATFDVARTVVRGAERRLVSLAKDQQLMGAVQGRPRQYTLAFMNRLSTLMYVLARHEAEKCGIIEKSPLYK